MFAPGLNSGTQHLGNLGPTCSLSDPGHGGNQYGGSSIALYSVSEMFVCVRQGTCSRWCIQLLCLLLSAAGLSWLTLEPYTKELRYFHPIVSNETMLCSPKGVICVADYQPWFKHSARAKCRRSASFEVFQQERKFCTLTFAFGDRGRGRNLLPCEDWNPQSIVVNFTRGLGSSWHPIGGSDARYDELYNKLVVSYTLSKNTSMHLEIRLFDMLIGARLRVSGTALHKSFLKATMKFPNTCRGTAYVDRGDENGYESVGFREWFHYAWRSATQAVPIAFAMNEPKVTFALSEACNTGIRNLRLRPHAVREGKFRPIDGFQAFFEKFKYLSPYIVLHVAENPALLASQNGMAGLLCDSTSFAPATKDTSWIKPGKVIRQMQLSTKNAFEYMRLCSKLNVQYLLADAGWYGPEDNPSSDPLSPTPVGGEPMDIPLITKFGASLTPPVYSILYLNDRVLLNHSRVERIAGRLSSMGVRGVKVGFVNVRSDEGMARLVTNIKIFESHYMIVNVHDSFRDYFLSRGYPCLLSAEGVRGSEHRTDETSNHLILPLTRMLTGRMDYTFTTSVDSLVQHGNITMLYQICLAFIFHNGLQHLFWYESVGSIVEQVRQNPRLQLWQEMPAAYNRTIVIQYNVGKSICMAREVPRSGNWFIFGIATVRTNFRINLSFLSPTSIYEATVFRETTTVRHTLREFLLEEVVEAKTGVFIVAKKVHSFSKSASTAKQNKGESGNDRKAKTTNAHINGHELLDELKFQLFLLLVAIICCTYIFGRRVDRRILRTKGKIV